MKRMKDVLESLSPGQISPGEAIRSLRNSQDLTLKDLEKITGISEPRLSSLENNRSSLSVNNARKIAAALGVNPITILFPSGAEGYRDKEIEKIEKKRERLLKKKIG